MRCPRARSTPISQQSVFFRLQPNRPLDSDYVAIAGRLAKAKSATDPRGSREDPKRDLKLGGRLVQLTVQKLTKPQPVMGLPGKGKKTTASIVWSLSILVRWTDPNTPARAIHALDHCRCAYLDHGKVPLPKAASESRPLLNRRAIRQWSLAVNLAFIRAEATRIHVQ